MIDLIYTTKAKQQRRFNLRTGHPDFEYTISKSSIVREIRTFKYYSYSSDQTVSLQTYIDGGIINNFPYVPTRLIKTSFAFISQLFNSLNFFSSI